VPEDAGKLAVQAGALMYCAEWKDNKGKLSDLVLPNNSDLQPVVRPDCSKGLPPWWGGYDPHTLLCLGESREGEMMVWIPTSAAN